MNEELSSALAEIINKSIQAGESALAFTAEQLPEVVEQLLLWKFVEYFSAFLLGFGAIVAAAYLLEKRIRWQGNKCGYYIDPEKKSEITDLLMPYTADDVASNLRYHAEKVIMFLSGSGKYRGPDKAPDHLYFFSALLLILGVVVSASTFTWVQILIAPKVYLIEYAAQFVKIGGAG